MPRYFIEISYNGANYAGFQIQQNAGSIQAEIEKALKTFFKTEFQLTGSSRTDAGVHALQNYFHFDSAILPQQNVLDNIIYNLNAILPVDIVIKQIYLVADTAHCRFDAKSRTYKYFIYKNKDPFISDTSYYYPYNLDVDKMNEAAAIILQQRDFTAFSKRNTQVKTFICSILKSFWLTDKNQIIYTVQANRFLRGMVRGLVGTMLKVGTGKTSINEFHSIIENKEAVKADFSVPAHGLFLVSVEL